jgi:hypothetical protein
VPRDVIEQLQVMNVHGIDSDDVAATFINSRRQSKAG